MLEVLNKEAKKLENTSFYRSVPKSFKYDLEDKIYQMNITKLNRVNDVIVKEELIQAKYQAYTMMGYRCYHDEADFIFSK